MGEGRKQKIRTMIDQILDYNKTFVAQKGYEKYITNKYPDKNWRYSRAWTRD